jgi:hypothetical protein
MNHLGARPFLLLLLLSQSVISSVAKPLALHPDNSHYFLYKGKPLIIITSAEHYGAVLNLDFDYVPYLNELRSKGLNGTRTFTGAYVEPQGAFNIEQNTLAPAPERFISPWARSSTPGYANGGNKFDLTQWDPAYFKRLKDFVAQAEKRDIIVEINLFCPFYEEPQWKLSPQNASNNINGMGEVARTNVYTLDKHGGLLNVHEAMVRKVVAELNGYDNIYYEICNEPYFGGVTIEWQHHIVDVIVEAEKKLRNKHLISMNISNGSARITNAHPAVSIFNFHYAAPPTTVAVNYGLNKVIGDNETGFRGTNNLPYRVEAWDFILAGGGLYNNLDYSFTAEHENGTFAYPGTQPGGGNPAFRTEMKILKDFINGFDFVKMKPDASFVGRGVPTGATARGLMEPGKVYAVYIGPTPVPKDLFSVRWVGKVEPKFSETYTFHTFSNDGVKLWIDGKPIVDNWTEHSGTENTGTIPLKAGQKVDLRLEYFQSAGGAALKLSWSSPSQKKEIVPASQFWTPDGRSHGLQGRYYTEKNFEHLQMSRVDRTIDFDWTDTSPFARILKPSETNQIANLAVKLPAGAYEAEWLNTKTGQVDKREPFELSGGSATLASPPYSEDIALRIKATKTKSNSKKKAQPIYHKPK